jgi:hypothetical protein
MTQGANGWWLARKNRREAEEFAHAHRQVFLNLMVEYGGGPRRLAKALNEAKIPSRNGGQWYSTTVIRMLRHLGEPFVKDLHEARRKAVVNQLRALKMAMR